MSHTIKIKGVPGKRPRRKYRRMRWHQARQEMRRQLLEEVAQTAVKHDLAARQLNEVTL